MPKILRTALAAVIVLLVTDMAAASRNAVHADAESVSPLLPGMSAPAFEVWSAAGEPVRFEPAEMQRPLVITFFRGGWCPYCNLHLAELRHAEAELKSMGFDVWFLSMDRPSVLAESEADSDEPLGYTLLSDARAEATRAFGIAFRLDDDTYTRYRDRGMDLEAETGQTHHLLPAPSTFVIDTDGTIRFQYTNPNYKLRLHPDVLLAAARTISEEQRLIERREAKRAAD